MNEIRLFFRACHKGAIVAIRDKAQKLPFFYSAGNRNRVTASPSSLRFSISPGMKMICFLMEPNPIRRSSQEEEEERLEMGEQQRL